MPTAEIVVLANSRKMGGRCVAGISLETGRWVRPVSSRSEGELSPGDCAVGGRPPRPLDLVRFRYRNRLDDPAQPENVLIDGGGWDLAGTVGSAEAYDLLGQYLEPGPALLGGVERGVADAVAQEGVDASLCLVEPDSIEFVSEPPFAPGKARRARAVFELAGQRYDPSHTLLTVSMTEPLNETRWKLAAAVHLLP